MTSIARHCSRCHKFLTDPASIEHGQGPECRKKNNNIFAKQIPAKLANCSILMMSFQNDMFHESIASQFEDIRALYLSKTQRLAMQCDANVPLVLAGGDFRKIVSWLEYSLSFPMSKNNRDSVIKLIDTFGYQALASILRGEATMSEAKIYMDGPYICMTGKANKNGWRAMRAIPGIQTPRYRGDTTPYKALACYAKNFVDIANQYWPFNVVSEDAQEALERPPVVQASNDPGEALMPAATLMYNSQWFVIKFPWHGTREEMMGMINEFKQINKNDRHYSPEGKHWSFKLAHLGKIKEIVGKRYVITDS